MTRGRLGLAVLLLAISAFGQTTTLSSLRLASTTLQTADAFRSIIAFCRVIGCTGSTPVVTPTTVVCPGGPRAKCTLKVHVDLYNLVATTNALIGFSFAADNTETMLQPGSALVAIFANPSGGQVQTAEVSATFVVRATNQYPNQRHPVEVDLVCRDEVAGLGGCTAGTAPNIFNAGEAPGAPVLVDIEVFSEP